MKILCSTLLLISFNLILTAQSKYDVTKNMKYINQVVTNVESIKIKKIQYILYRMSFFIVSKFYLKYLNNELYISFCIYENKKL